MNNVVTNIHGVDILKTEDGYYVANFSVSWFYNKDLETTIRELKDYMINHYQIAIQKTINTHSLPVSLEDVNKMAGSLMLSLFDFKCKVITETSENIIQNINQ